MGRGVCFQGWNNFWNNFWQKKMVQRKTSREGPTVGGCWKDRRPRYMDSSKRLAAAIFVTALKDCQEGSQEARDWILKDKSSFPFWCRVYGISPTIARQELEQAIRTAPVTLKCRKKLITQALRKSPEMSDRKIGRQLGCSYATVGRLRKLMPLSSATGESQRR